jgi:hypothetical protein
MNAARSVVDFCLVGRVVGIAVWFLGKAFFDMRQPQWVSDNI